MKEFLLHFVNRFKVSEDGHRIGFIKFSSKATLLFDFKETSHERILQKIASIPLKLQYRTRTDKALKLAERLFSKRLGDRRDYRNLLFVFTDGNPTNLKKSEPIKDIVPRLEVGQQ